MNVSYNLSRDLSECIVYVRLFEVNMFLCIIYAFLFYV